MSQFNDDVLTLLSEMRDEARRTNEQLADLVAQTAGIGNRLQDMEERHVIRAHNTRIADDPGVMEKANAYNDGFDDGVKAGLRAERKRCLALVGAIEVYDVHAVANLARLIEAGVPAKEE